VKNSRKKVKNRVLGETEVDLKNEKAPDISRA